MVTHPNREREIATPSKDQSRQFIELLHDGYFVEFLSDATGTLNVENTAGKVMAEELHNAILVSQQMFISEVLTTRDWLAKIA